MHVVKATPPFPYQRTFDDELKRTGLMRVFVEPTVVPTRGMTCTVDSVDFEVIEVEPVYSGEQVVLYSLMLGGDGVLTLSASSTTLDSRLVPTTLRLVKRLGKQATFDTYATETYDPTTGSMTRSGLTRHVVKVTPPSEYEDQFVDGDLIREQDVRIFLPGKDLTFQPQRGGIVTLDLEGTSWKIVAVHPIYSGEQVVLWELQLR